MVTLPQADPLMMCAYRGLTVPLDSKMDVYGIGLVWLQAKFRMPFPPTHHQASARYGCWNTYTWYIALTFVCIVSVPSTKSAAINRGGGGRDEPKLATTLADLTTKNVDARELAAVTTNASCPEQSS